MCESTLPRRDVLSALAGLGLATLAPNASATRRPAGRIDIHYHHIVPEWLDAAASETPPFIMKIAKAWSPAVAIEAMDQHGIRTAVCSVSNPGIWFGDVAQGRRLARACNEYAARMRQDHPGRFGSFAALPLPDIEGSLAELAYALDVLKADGIGLFTSYGDKWLADPAFAPVFKELDRRKTTVYVHPTAPTCCQRLVPGVPPVLMEFTVDTSRTILDWMMTRSSDLYPNVNLIFSHAGGLFMAGIGRLQILSDTQPVMRLPKNIAAEAARHYYETSSSADKVTMDLLRAYVPPTHILLGTDAPFIGDVAPNLRQFERLALTATERRAIERDNAARLMPHLG